MKCTATLAALLAFGFLLCTGCSETTPKRDAADPDERFHRLTNPDMVKHDVRALRRALHVLMLRREYEAAVPVVAVLEDLDEQAYLEELLHLCRLEGVNHYRLAARLAQAEDRKYIPHLKALALQKQSGFSTTAVTGLLPFGYEHYKPFIKHSVGVAADRFKPDNIGNNPSDATLLLYSGDPSHHETVLTWLMDFSAADHRSRRLVAQTLVLLYGDVYDFPAPAYDRHGRPLNQQKETLKTFATWLAQHKDRLHYDQEKERMVVLLRTR